MSSATSQKLFLRPNQAPLAHPAASIEPGSATPVPVGPLKRKPERVSIAISVAVAGTDLNGQSFVERAQTEHVGRDGAWLVINRFLGPDQQVVVQRAGGRTEAVARIIGQAGIRRNGYVYGIEISGSGFWGVQFPPAAGAAASRPLRCTCCATSEQVAMNEVELSVLEANGILSRPCTECRATTFWKVYAAAADGNGSTTSPSAKPSRRRNLRTTMKTSACICQPTGLRDLASVLDISRGGIAFRSARNYSVHSWIELAVPYTEGGANIFVAGRIVWERQTGAGFREYGVQYVKN